ncbi:MAG TPA: type III PLP-dependent enzyme [Gammaproteobacteria bacterium]|nr:type III PLP-dependent enzyme [Gammaproteobacteria bacterium]
MYRRFKTVEELASTLSPEQPMYCFRPGIVAEQARAFLSRFPGRVMFAVKSNPHPAVLGWLHDAGIREFDTASPGEMELIRDRFPQARCYYMHAVKGRSAIARASHEFGIRHFVVDHPAELEKLRQVLGHEDIVVMVRLATRSERVKFDLSDKFGASVEDASLLLDAAAAEGYATGLCFHVGSQCLAPGAFADAFHQVRKTLRICRSKITCLDVGGGFPAHYADTSPPALEEFIEAIEREFASLGLENCELMCEPGRALVAESMSVLTRVELRKDRRIYLNDGIYGSLHGMVIGVRFPLKRVRPGISPVPHDTEFLAYGPTCDGLDELPQRLLLPGDVDEGDWIEFGCIGAYTLSLRTTFNGFYPDDFVIVDAPFRDPDRQSVSPAAAPAS